MEYDICDMRFLNLNSSNATLNNSTYLSDVKFDFKNILTDDTDIKYVTCGVLNAQIPVSFYTINYTNYLLNFSVDGGAIIPLIITQGNYNSNSLITEIISEFLLLGYTFTISTSRITGIMSFNCVGHSFTFYGTSTIFHILGFTSGTNYASSSSTIIAPYPLNLLGIKRLNVSSQSLSTNVYDSKGLGISSSIASIPVDTSSFGMINYVNTSNAYPILRAHTVSYVDIQIYDEDNNFINFNGINWTITVQINIFRKGRNENKNMSMLPIINILSDIRDELTTEEQSLERGTKDNSENITDNQDNIDNIAIDTSNQNLLPAVDEPDDDLDFLLYNGVF